jgi:hypothetical protein
MFTIKYEGRNLKVLSLYNTYNMSCFCQRPNALSPSIYRKIELLEKQISNIFCSSTIDLYLVQINRLSHDSREHPDIQLIYHSNMDRKERVKSTEETVVMGQIFTAINNFGTVAFYTIINIILTSV